MSTKDFFTPEQLQALAAAGAMEVERRITPSMISELANGEVFVFGSNVHGMHAGGAARAAMKYFGAEWGNGEGLQGCSYAIPTMEGRASTKAAVERFCSFAKEHPELRLLVTPIGCGIAGYRPSDIAPFFAAALPLGNVCLPLSFWNCFVQANNG